MTTTTKTRACKWCGEPVETPIRRGRPAELHDDPCRRLYKNRRTLNNRIALFRAAHRYNVDRTDVNPFAAADYDAVRLDEGYMPVSGAYDNVHGDALLEAMKRWEERRATLRLMRRLEREMLAEMDDDARELWEASKGIPPEEYEALLRRGKGRRPSPDYARHKAVLSRAGGVLVNK